MTQGHRALDWLARRHDGESIALIAYRAGVTPDTVKAATATYGPFPRATAHLGRTIASDAALQQRARAWVHQRRAGRTVTDIARDAGVAHQHVSKATIDHGPFPAPDVVTAWVEARTEGRTIAAIAHEWTVRPATMRTATRPYGPFRTPGPRRPLWLHHTVTRWLATTKTLATCPRCGARCLSVTHHAQTHPHPGSRPSDTADQ